MFILKKYFLMFPVIFQIACTSHVDNVENSEPTVINKSSNEIVSEVVTKPDPQYDFMNKDSASADESQSKYCEGLSRKVEELRGKPQRHSAALQRYEYECKRDIQRGDVTIP